MTTARRVSSTATVTDPTQAFERDLLSYSITAQTRPGNKTSWLAYGAASSVALLASSGVEAAIVYSGAQNIVLAPGIFSLASTSIDMDGGGNDVRFRAFSNDVLAYGRGGAQIATDGGYVARKFSSGQLIGTAGSSLGPAGGLGAALAGGGFTAGFTSSTGFMGVQLGSGNYGWIQVHVDLGPAVLTILDWAYDDTGAHIAAGARTAAVAEPRTTMLLGMGLLALGASGVRTLRRRKHEAGLTDPVNAAA